MFAVSIQQWGEYYNKNPFFQIQVEQRNYITDDEGERTKNTTYIDLEPCTLEHWTGINPENSK